MSVYIPSHFASDDVAIARELIDAHAFATLVTPVDAEALVTHLPLLREARASGDVLVGHFARANPHARAAAVRPSLAIFHGPHAYVSPSWYAEPAKAVPTWNYAAVHAHGVLEIVQDPVETRQILDTLVQRFEGTREAPWRFAMPERQRDALVNAIVAFRLRIRRFDAKFKLSQNRPRDDQRRVAAALENEGYADAAAVAQWMRTYAATSGGQ